MLKNATRCGLSVLLSLSSFLQAESEELLSSWNEGTSKSAIIEFVNRIQETGGAQFVPEEDRIAVFDNDGTLWSEKPIYFQLQFAIDRVKQLAPQHPEWKDTQPYKAAINDDLATLAKGGVRGIMELVIATHTKETTAQFLETVRQWMATAEHPRFHRPYVDLTYRPMRDLMDYLRANGFQVYIVSGGGVEFMRVFTWDKYGVPAENVMGSSVKTQFELEKGVPVIMRLPEINFICDGPTKPVAINGNIGKRPIFAFGNSDGDLQMLEWTTVGRAPSLGLLVHHDDAVREWAYDRKSDVGKLDKGLDEASKRGWVVVSMKNDWKDVFYPKD